MSHWKSFMERDYIFAFDLNGRDVNVQIRAVTGGTLVGEGGRKTKKPVMFFHGKEKGLALNATNCKTLTALFGSPDTEAWKDGWITLYPTTTEMNGEQKECIRIRPRKPAIAGRIKPEVARPPQPHEEPETQLLDDAADSQASEPSGEVGS